MPLRSRARPLGLGLKTKTKTWENELKSRDGLEITILLVTQLAYAVVTNSAVVTIRPISI